MSGFEKLPFSMKCQCEFLEYDGPLYLVDGPMVNLTKLQTVHRGCLNVALARF